MHVLPHTVLLLNFYILLQDGDNINNYVEVGADPANSAARQRLLAEDGCMTEEERAAVIHYIEAPEVKQ